MANPQKEDGYVALANVIVEKLCKYRLSGQEWQILWVILRKTYGWNKKMDRIALSQFSKMTGIDRSKCHGILKGLINKNIIIKDVTQKVNSKSISYGIRKDFDKWKVLPKRSTGKDVTQKVNKVFPKRSTKVLTIWGTTKDNKPSLNHLRTPQKVLKPIFYEEYCRYWGSNEKYKWKGADDGQRMRTIWLWCNEINPEDPLSIYKEKVRIAFDKFAIETLGGILTFWNRLKKDNRIDYERLLKTCLTDLEKTCNKEKIKSWLYKFPPKYHIRIFYGLNKIYPGGHSYSKAKDQYEKEKK